MRAPSVYESCFLLSLGLFPLLFSRSLLVAPSPPPGQRIFRGTLLSFICATRRQARLPKQRRGAEGGCGMHISHWLLLAATGYCLLLLAQAGALAVLEYTPPVFWVSFSSFWSFWLFSLSLGSLLVLFTFYLSPHQGRSPRLGSWLDQYLKVPLTSNQCRLLAFALDFAINIHDGSPSYLMSRRVDCRACSMSEWAEEGMTR